MTAVPEPAGGPTLLDLFAAARPADDAEFLRGPEGATWTYGALDHETARLAHALRESGV